MHRQRYLPVRGFAFTALTILGLVPTAAAEESLEAGLRTEAPRVMKYLTEHRYGTVGVLKFAVKKGDQAAALDAGTLNAAMATRLEHALILLADPTHPLEVIHDPSGATSRHDHPGDFYHSSAGRRSLFDREYPVAWGSQAKRPDAFLTGEVVVHKDMKTLELIIQAFDHKDAERLQEVARIKNLAVDRSVLVGIGQSFALSRGLKHRHAREVDADADAAKRDDTGASPLRDGDDPVTLQVFYDGQPVALEADAASPGEVKINRTRAADPKEGQRVKFVVRNVGQDTVGVVLAINGKNTLFQEDLASKPVAECTKWVIAAGESYTVEGFYMSEDGKEVRPFKILSDAESAQADMDPTIKGVFSMAVFSAAGPGPDSAALNVSQEADAADLSRSPKQKGAARSLIEAQTALRAATHTHAVNGRLRTDPAAQHPALASRRVTQKGGRGLVVADEQATTGSNLNRVAVKFGTSPTMSLFIRYYAATSATPAS